jgi:predicted lipoprotein with Yx(FWY)xxD motif
MKKISALLLLIGLLAFVAGCGEDDDGEATTAASATEEEAAMEKEDDAMAKEDEEEDAMAKEDEAMAEEEAMAKEGTTVVLGDSEFGEMIYDTNDQAIYVFEQDETDKSNCYGECAAAWPPVLTKGEPVAGDGVDESLLGTTKRDDGSTQVTYGGRPLYYYVNEGPGEVRCHNVDLNGGFWWVVGADGEPLA